MRKIIYSAVMVITLLALTITMGCSAFTNSNAAAAKILRKSPIGTNSQVYQFEVTVPAGGSLPVILKLAEGDNVQGYFYVEKGDTDIDLTISGNTQFYKSNTVNLPASTPVSDRFTFTASFAAQGLSYTLTLTNNKPATAKTKSTIFMEVIYPGTNPPFTPAEK